MEKEDKVSRTDLGLQQADVAHDERGSFESDELVRVEHFVRRFVERGVDFRIEGRFCSESSFGAVHRSHRICRDDEAEDGVVGEQTMWGSGERKFLAAREGFLRDHVARSRGVLRSQGVNDERSIY